jgi:hypothetical protein
MKIARFWEKGRVEAHATAGNKFPVVAWGWSENSREEAKQRAREAATRAARWLESNWPKRERGQYYAQERPPREEIVREITVSSGDVVATITRNAYGSLVLNTAHLMFIDVDVPPDPVSSRLAKNVLGWLGRPTETAESRVQKHIEQTATEYSQHTIRLYRTAAGFRCVVTDRPIVANSEESRRLFEAFGTDPLYAQICRVQECYRARLTPKFWRCRAQRPPHRFPWVNANEEQEQRRWEEEYSRRSQEFATCRFVTQFGNRTDAELRSLIELHDAHVGAQSELPLA